MSTYDWPTERIFVPQQFAWGATERIAEAPSGYTGANVTGEVPFAYRYRVSVAWAPASDMAVQMQRIGFAAKIRRSHRIRIPHFGFARSGFVPYGTLRGTPTVASTAAKGAASISVTTSTSGHTVAIGDLLGLTTSAGLQVVTVTAAAAASGTALTVAFEPPLRAAVSGGSSVTWSKPAPTFMLAGSDWSASFRPGEASPISLEFVEMWS